MIIFSLRRRLLSFFFACIVLFSITIGFSDARVAAQSKSTLCKMIYAEERYEGDEGENLHVLRILSDDVLVVRDCRNISMRPTEFDCKVEFIRRELVARMVFSAGDEGKTPPSSDLGDQSHYGMRVRQNEKSEAVSHLLQRVPCR